MRKEQLVLEFEKAQGFAEEKQLPFVMTLSQFKGIAKQKKCALSGTVFDENIECLSQSFVLLEVDKGFVKGNMIAVLNVLANTDDPFQPLDVYLKETLVQLFHKQGNLNAELDTYREEGLAIEEKRVAAVDVLDDLEVQVINNEEAQLSIVSDQNITNICAEATEAAKVNYVKLVKKPWYKRMFK